MHGKRRVMAITDPNLLLKKFRLQLRDARVQAENGNGFAAGKATALALEAMAQLDKHLTEGGTLPIDWLKVPEHDPNKIWIDSGELLTCCLRELLGVRDDPDMHKNGSHIKCGRCGTHIVFSNGVWKWGLPPERQRVNTRDLYTAAMLEELIAADQAAARAAESDD